MKTSKADLGAMGIALLTGLVLFIGSMIYFGFSNSNIIVDQSKEYLLRSYELQNQRMELENQRLYLKTLELSCTAEFINQYGEVYIRQ